MNFPSLAAGLLALSSGLVTWIADRRILRHRDDAAFPERYLRHRITMMQIFVAMAAVVAVIDRVSVWWTLPLLFISISAGAHSARRVIYDETWTLTEFVWYRSKALIGGGGFWILLTIAPLVILAIGAESYPVVLLVLVLWFVFYQEIFRWALDSEPLNDEVLLARFKEIDARASSSPERVYATGPRGGVWANALAMPAGKSSSILISRTLLKELNVDELTAVYAHEVSHLEHYNQPKAALSRYIAMLSVIVLAVVPFGILLEYSKNFALLYTALWPLVFLVGMARALATRQSHETDSDLRAIDLGADPLALISGLTKLHETNKFPRRFDSGMEKRASHPSLSRRIQAIRKKAGLGEDEIVAPVPAAFQNTKKNESIVWTETGITFWSDKSPEEALAQVSSGATPARSIAYEQIRSLTVRQALTGLQLGGKMVDGSPIAFQPKVEDLARFQELLDQFDHRFAAAVVRQAPLTSYRQLRLLLLLLLVLALVPGVPWAVFFAALFAMIFCSPASITAAGAIALPAAWQSYERISAIPALSQLGIFSITLAAVGTVCIVYALRRAATENGTPSPRRFMVSMAVLAAIAVFPIAISLFRTMPVARLGFALSQQPSLLLYGVAIATASLYVQRRRTAAGAVLATMLLLFTATRQPLLGLLGVDPLISTRAAVLETELPAVAEARLPLDASSLQLSESGRAFTARLTPFEDEQPLTMTFAVGDENRYVRIDAAAVRLIDDSSVLALLEKKDALQLVVLQLPELSPGAWSVSLPKLNWVQITTPEKGVWQVTGAVDENHGRSFRGRIGENKVEEVGTQSFRSAVWAQPKDPLAYVESRKPEVAIASMIFQRPMFESELWSRQGAQKARKVTSTLLQTRVIAFPSESSAQTILASDGQRTHLSTFDPASGRITKHAHVPGTVVHAARNRNDIFAGTSSGDAIVLNLRTRRGATIVPKGFQWPLDIATAGDRVAVLMRDRSRSILTWYSLAPLQ